MGFLSNGKPRVFTVTGISAKDCINKMLKKESEFENENPLQADESNIKKIILTDLCIQHLKYDISIDALKPSSSNRRELAHYISLTQRIISDGEVINVVRFPGPIRN